MRRRFLGASVTGGSFLPQASQPRSHQ
jgi:hypothetical protein